MISGGRLSDLNFDTTGDFAYVVDIGEENGHLYILLKNAQPTSSPNWIAHPTSNHQYSLTPAMGWPEAKALAETWGGLSGHDQ